VRRMVSSGVFANPPKPFLMTTCSAVMGLQRVDDLRPPGALDDERAGGVRMQPNPPIGELRVRIVGLHHVGKIDNWPSRGAEGVGELLHRGNGSHDKWEGDPSLRLLTREVREAALRMDEIVLHIHDQQCGLGDLRSEHRHLPGWSRGKAHALAPMTTVTGPAPFHAGEPRTRHGCRGAVALRRCSAWRCRAGLSSYR